jgi:excinuclease ABC subunit C
MDLHEKIRTLPTLPGVYQYHNAAGEVIYVGKAKNLRARVRSYFLESAAANAKTGSLMREAVDLEYIVVDNEKEALALENNLIKQKQPRFNIMLRDDKTYPYVKLTMHERFPRVYVTRRLKKDGSAYFGPYLPASLAYRVVELIHRHFLVPSCTVDLRRYHPRACLQYYIGRCLGPCVEKLTTPEAYAEAVRDARLLLEGKPGELARSLTERMAAAAENQQYELAAKYRDLIATVEQISDKQRMDTVEGEDADVFGYHYENQMLAVNLFHMRSGRVLDRREFFWEDIPSFGLGGEPEDAAEFHPSEFFSALLKQLYIDQQYVPHAIYAPVDFEDRGALEQLLAETRGRHVHIESPVRGEKRALVDLAGKNAKQSYDQRFRVLKPNAKLIAASLQEALTLPEPPRRIECFDISHIQGSETVASMVVWEDGQMKKADYRKFIIRTVSGVDDFASMHEVVTRRYQRLKDEEKPLPSLVLIDGGLGQLHAAAEALEALGLASQPVAAIAKKEEIIYVLGQEDEPIALDRHSPVLHLVQMVRDEAHRFAVTYHRQRRAMRDRETTLLAIPGVGERTTRRLLEHFGSVQAVREADAAALSAVVTRAQAEAILAHFQREAQATTETAPPTSR